MQFDKLIQQRHEHSQRGLYIKINCVTSFFFRIYKMQRMVEGKAESTKKKQWGVALAK